MIYFTKSHDDGAATLTRKYDLREVGVDDYIPESTLLIYLPITDSNILFDAIQSHPDLHAYSMPDLQLYFHPDPLLKMMREAHKNFFLKLIEGY